MIWRLWSSRPTVRIRIDVGYGFGAFVRSINILLKKRARLLELKRRETRMIP